MKQKPITLNPDPRNPNRMSDDDKGRMARSLAEFGDLSGICLNKRTGLLVGGHQRCDVLRDGKQVIEWLAKPEQDGTVGRGHILHLGRKYSLRIVDWPAEKARSALLAANRFGRVGEDDGQLLKDLLEELDDGKTDMDLTGYSEAAIEELMNQVHQEEAGEGLGLFGEDETDSESLVKTLVSDARFPGAEPWDMPIIREDKLVSEPNSLELWTCGSHPVGPVMWNYNSDSTVGINWRETIISFYVEDTRFEVLWNKTGEIVQRWLNLGVKSVVSPNYSAYYKWPRALRLYNIFRSRWIARYLQEAGIRVIIDISGSVKDVEFLCDGIPLGCPLAFQIHREAKDNCVEKNAVIQYALEKICPAWILVYGTEEKMKLYSAFSARSNIRRVESRSRKMKQRVLTQERG